MPKFKLRTKSGIVAVMLLGALFSAVPSQGGRIQHGAQAKEASTSRDERLAEASEARIKELRATEKEMPNWGDLGRRAELWELTTAMSLLYAGADILILYHPQAVAALKRAIARLGDDGE